MKGKVTPQQMPENTNQIKNICEYLVTFLGKLWLGDSQIMNTDYLEVQKYK